MTMLPGYHVIPCYHELDQRSRDGSALSVKSVYIWWVGQKSSSMLHWNWDRSPQVISSPQQNSFIIWRFSEKLFPFKSSWDCWNISFSLEYLVWATMGLKMWSKIILPTTTTTDQSALSVSQLNLTVAADLTPWPSAQHPYLSWKENNCDVKNLDETLYQMLIISCINLS